MIRNIVPFGDAINVPWRLMMQSIQYFIPWAVVTAECIAWENEGARILTATAKEMTRFYMEKDETKMVFGGKDTVVDFVDPLTCGAIGQWIDGLA